MELKDKVQKLNEYKTSIEKHRVGFQEKLKDNDWPGAWKHFVLLLEMCGRGLKICNETLNKDMLPEFKKAVEKKGFKLPDREEILKESEENIVKKETVSSAEENKVESEPISKVKKMIMIPKKTSIH